MGRQRVPWSVTTIRRRWAGGTLAVILQVTALASIVIADETQVLRYQVRTGALVDLGWTGIAHAQPWPAAQRLTFGRTCPDDGEPCALGGGRAGDPFGVPIPLSSGGTPACVVNRLRAAVEGTMRRKDGCAEIQLALTSRVHLAQDVAQPCPVCDADPSANDGRREGRCSAGERAGTPCDAQATSTHFGPTSNDCLPTGPGVGDLVLDVTLTTGKVKLGGGQPCVNLHPGGTCLCAAQAQQNACHTGACPSDGRCDQGPFDGVCAGQPYRACAPGSGTKDCDERSPGAGSCQVRSRPCFGETIEREGICHPTMPTFVAGFCAPATRATALNVSAGLPGPALLTLPLELLDEPGHPAGRLQPASPDPS